MAITPMFPLGSVLLPGEPLPLHIFEPRYRQMLTECMAMDDPSFGVVLIARGHAIVAAIALVPPSRAVNPGRIDWVGGMLSVSTVSTVVYAIIEGMHSGWGIWPTYSAVVGALSGAAFVAWELRHPNPLLDVRSFRSRILSGAVLAVLLFFLVTFGAIYYVAQYLQFVLGFGPVSTGMHLLPLAAAVFVGSGVTQWLTPKLGMKYTVTAGMVVGTAAMVSLFGIDTSATYVDFVPVLGLLGLGIGLSVSPCTDAIMAEFPDNKLGVAGGLNDTALELGGSLGIAILGSVLATTYRGGIVDFLAGFPGTGPGGQPTEQATQAVEASGDSVAGAVIVAEIMRENPFLTGYADDLQRQAISSFVGAVVHTSLIAAVVFGVGAVVVAALLPTPITRRLPVMPPAFDPAAAREVAELERLLEQPSADKPVRAKRGDQGPTVPGGSTEAQPSRASIYQLAAMVHELDAATKAEAALEQSDHLTIHQLVLSDIARKRREEAEDQLDVALELPQPPARRPTTVVPPAAPNIYQYADSAYRRCTEFKERSSSVWAMPL